MVIGRSRAGLLGWDESSLVQCREVQGVDIFGVDIELSPLGQTPRRETVARRDPVCIVCMAMFDGCYGALFYE